jgi:DNA mismatch repair ATPase MutS
VETFARHDHTTLRVELRKQLKGFMNMLVFCTRIKAGKGKWRDWQQLVLVRLPAGCH